MKLAASVLLALPIAVLVLFTVGEMVGGDVSGVQHIVQAAPLLLLLAGAWRYPRAAGIVLLGVGAVLFAIWLVLVLGEGEPAPRSMAILMWAGAGLIFFVPPLVAGWLLLKARRLAR